MSRRVPFGPTNRRGERVVVMFERAPNVVVEDAFRSLIRRGYRAEVVCEESTVTEEDLDFAWTLLPSSDLQDLGVDLPGDRSAAGFG